MTRCNSCWWIALLALMIPFGSARATGSPSGVPFVGCTAIGGPDPGATPAPVRPPKSLPVPSAQAGNIAFYQAADGPGVFAPRGWHCQTWHGSNGAFIVVTPGAPRQVIPPDSLDGPGVIAIYRFGGTSGRFEVAEVSARVFPELMADFISRVKAEGFEYPDFSRIEPFTDDLYDYITPSLLTFTTPARHEGIGIGIFKPSADPVRGLIGLSSEDQRETDLLQFQLRLPSSQSSLGEVLLSLERQCVQRSWPGC